MDHTDRVTLGKARGKHADLGHSILIVRRFQGMARRAGDGDGDEETKMIHIVVRGPQTLKSENVNIKTKSKVFGLSLTHVPNDLLSGVT